MHVSNDCPYASTALREWPRQFQPPPHCCRGGDWRSILIGDLPPLCQSAGAGIEVYRFVWLSSFDGSADVRISHDGNLVWLQWELRNFRWPGRPQRQLSSVDWDRLQEGLARAAFWSRPTVDERVLGFDGEQLLIEGLRDSNYAGHATGGPDGALSALGQLFFDVAGPPLSNIRLY
jgi:hypothetical protein